MWDSIDFSILSVNQEFITEPEQLIFPLVAVFIAITFSFIFRVYFAIQNEEIRHQNIVGNYHKLLIASKREIEKESLNETNFNIKQAVFINDILEVKNQWTSLKLFLNPLRKTQ